MMDNFEKIFIEQALINTSSVSKEYKDNRRALNVRKKLLNKSFVFNKKTIKQIEEINLWLAQKENNAYEQACRLEKFVLSEIRNNNTFISDYEIEFKVSFFSERKYANYAEMQGNPFFICKDYIPRFLKKESADKKLVSWIFKENHNEFRFHNHPLKDQHHCMLFHHLYNHTILSWQDLIDIEEIWFEVNLIVQNMSKK